MIKQRFCIFMIHPSVYSGFWQPSVGFNFIFFSFLLQKVYSNFKILFFPIVLWNLLEKNSCAGTQNCFTKEILKLYGTSCFWMTSQPSECARERKVSDSASLGHRWRRMNSIETKMETCSSIDDRSERKLVGCRDKVVWTEWKMLSRHLCCLTTPQYSL